MIRTKCRTDSTYAGSATVLVWSNSSQAFYYAPFRVSAENGLHVRHTSIALEYFDGCHAQLEEDGCI